MTIRRALFFSLSTLFLFSCTAELEEKNQNLETKVDSLSSELQNKQQTLDAFDQSFSEIQKNLEMISKREESIKLNSEEIDENRRENITRDIQAINTLLEENQQTINNLNKSLENYKGEVSGFKKLVNSLQADLKNKENQISRLKEDLTAANFALDILNEKLDSTEMRNQVQKDIIEVQTQELNKVYYSLGSFKELNEMGVVEKKGDIIGIAGTKSLKDDFNKEAFVEVDKRKFKTLEINSDEAKIVTTHPPESFELTGEEQKQLKIKDPERFWSASKYLVILND